MQTEAAATMTDSPQHQTFLYFFTCSLFVHQLWPFGFPKIQFSADEIFLTDCFLTCDVMKDGLFSGECLND